ncbi:MAG: hypothetical protein ACTSWX_01230 [Promethearchaeota archaeon]
MAESKNLIVVEDSRTTGDKDNSWIIREYDDFLKKEGLEQTTTESYVSSIESLLNNSVDILNPESVKEYIAGNTKAGKGRKRNIVHAYKQFHKMCFGNEMGDSAKNQACKKATVSTKRRTSLTDNCWCA